MEVVVFSDIPRLRKMKGESRIWIPNDISEYILGVEYENFPGIGHAFLESKPQTSTEGEWIEHRWLLRGMKNLNLSDLFKTLGKLMLSLELFRGWEEKVDYCGLEEIDGADPIHYYFLISILSHGKDYNKENTCKKD